VEKKYNQYCKTFVHCLPYGTTKEWQKISYAQSQGFNDVQIQCRWIFEKLKERQKQCDYLIELTNSYDEKYKENLKFIASSEQYINEYNSDSVDPATQLEKCAVSILFCKDSNYRMFYLETHTNTYGKESYITFHTYERKK